MFFIVLYFIIEKTNFAPMLKVNFADLIGHMDPIWIIHATEEEVRAKCRRQIDLYKHGGGFVLATGCEYPANASFENARIMVDEAKIYGMYW